MNRVLICHVAGGAQDARCRPLYEYARTLTSKQQALGYDRGIDAEFLTFDNVDWGVGESQLRRQVEALAAGREVVLFLHTVFPFVGGALPLSLFADYPSVLFPHQLELLPGEGQHQTSIYLQHADTVVVTARDEIGAAERLSASLGLPSVTARFVVVPQPPAFRPEEAIDLQTKSDDVIYFGMLRQGKGLDEVVDLARLLASEPGPKARWLDVVGHVSSRRDSLALLIDLVIRAWDLFPPDGGGLERLSLAEATELVDHLEGRLGNEVSRSLRRRLGPRLVRRLQAPREALESHRRLPLRIHVSVPRAEASRLLARARYAYLPVEGGELHRPSRRVGLTAHSSSAPTVAAHGVVLVAPIGERTPPALRHGVVVPADSAREAHAAIQRLDRQPEARTAAARRALEWSAGSRWQTVAERTVRAALGSLERFGERRFLGAAV